MNKEENVSQTGFPESVTQRSGSRWPRCLHVTQPALQGKLRKLEALLFAGCLLSCASSVRAQTSGVNNAIMNGNYAFNLNGFDVGGGGSSAFAAVGRFTADGAGNVTNGELDINSAGPVTALTAQSFTGTYAIGTDNRGVMTLDFQGGSIGLAFAMMANGNAQVIRFDAADGSGTVASGTIEKVTGAANTRGIMSGDYGFEVAGFDALNNRASFLGRLTANGSGAFTNEAADIYQYGTTNPVIFVTANYDNSDTTTGRGTINFACLVAGVSQNFNFVFYAVNKGEVFMMETDAVTGSTSLLNGLMLAQQTPSLGFSSASLNGQMVIYLTAYPVCGSSSSPSPAVLAGSLTADGISALNLTFDENCGGSSLSVTDLPGTYVVAPNGRVSLTIGPYNVYAYLLDSNYAFLLGNDSSGFIKPQAGGALNNGSLNGNYAGLAIDPADSGVAIFSGEFTADGSSPTGSMTGSKDIGASSGPISGSGFDAAYSISSSPTNGRGTMTITSGSGGSAVVYVISPKNFVAVPLNDPNPAIWNFQSAPAPAPPPVPATLSLLTLSPTSVIGGVQSSKGTVTLTAPAPTGGAQVLLSSSDPAAASVPSSVTVSSGATSATFTVNTSIVLISTSASITASYNGTTQTASLDVLL